MLKKILRFLRNKQRVLDTVNVVLGLLMLTALVVFWKTRNKVSVYLIIFAGALMNISNGYTYLQSKDHKQMGYSMILLGMVILVFGFIIFLMVF